MPARGTARRLLEGQRGSFMSTPRRLDREHLEEILHELKAINTWDRDFFSAEEPDPLEFAAWEARRIRVFQILQELSHIRIGSPDTVH